MEKFIEDKVFEEKEGISMNTFETYKFKKKEWNESRRLSGKVECFSPISI